MKGSDFFMLSFLITASPRIADWVGYPLMIVFFVSWLAAACLEK